MNSRLARSLDPVYGIRNSWASGLGRDWTREELIAFAATDGPVFVHNHVVNWDHELADLYRRAGFFLFTFVRHVGDQLCSLYFWMRQQGGVPEHLSLHQFIRLQVSGATVSGIDYHHWQIPPYWQELHYADVFSERRFTAFVEDTLNLQRHETSVEACDRNSSYNRGYRHYCGTGEIESETQRLVEESDFQRRFLAVQQIGAPQSNEIVKMPRPRRMPMQRLPDCDCRAPTGEPNVYYCRHPKVHARGNRVSGAICSLCSHFAVPCPNPRPLDASGVPDTRKPPPLYIQAWNLAAALAAFAADGLRTVSKKQYEQRLRVCDTCEERRGTRCLQCGCRLPWKATGRAFDCPLGKWPDAHGTDATDADNEQASP